MHQYRSGDVDLSDPVLHRVLAERGRGLDDGLRVHEHQLAQSPVSESGRLEMRSRHLSNDAPRYSPRNDLAHLLEYRQERELHVLERSGPEARAGRTQDEPGDPVAMPAPQELGDRASQRIADSDESPELQGIGERDDVVGGIFEREGLRPSNSLSMPAKVRCDDVESMLEGRERREPIEGRRCAKTVQKDDGRGTGQTLALVDEGRAATRHLDHPPGGSGGLEPLRWRLRCSARPYRDDRARLTPHLRRQLPLSSPANRTRDLPATWNAVLRSSCRTRFRRTVPRDGGSR